MTDNDQKVQIVYEQLFINHFEELCVFSYFYVTDIEQAKDIVQESFLSLWQVRERYQLSKELLYTTVKKKSIDYLRSSYHKNNNKRAELDGLVASVIANQEEDLFAKDLSAQVSNCIEELPAQCKKIFLMSRTHKLRNKEIADKLDISTKAVEKHITKALKTIREYIKEKGYILLLAFLNHPGLS